MLSHTLITRIILFTFLVFVGFAIAMGIYYQSFWGITLAFIALGAVIYFISIIAKAKKALAEAEIREE